jgi:hypothetical protein
VQQKHLRMTKKEIPQYPKGDFRRLLAVLAAIDGDEGATLVQIVAKTRLDKKSVTHLIAQAREQAGVNITKTGPTYHIADWGEIIKRAGAKKVLTGAFNAPIVRA